MPTQPTLFYARPTSSPARSIVASLNREWESIAHLPAEWTDDGVTLAMALQSIRFNPDRVLLSLICACHDGHQAAGRVVIQALLGKLVDLAHSHKAAGISNLVPALWLRISTYPIQRRPTAVAANLVLDALRDTLRENRGLACAEEVHPDPVTAHDILAAARELGLVSPRSLAIVESVYDKGMDSQQAATVHNLTPAAVRRRCCDAVKKLREHRDSLSETCEPEITYVYAV